jgi:hypothetical protein
MGQKSDATLEISWCAGLGSHANAGRCAAAFLALETDVAEEAVSGDASTLEEQGEGVVCDPPASTRQAQKRIALVDCLSDTARSPKGIDFHAAIIAQEEPNHSLLARCHDYRVEDGMGLLPDSRACCYLVRTADMCKPMSFTRL